MTRQWIVLAENCACGALLDALKCREQTNRSAAHCWPTPINHEPLASSATARELSYFTFAINHLPKLNTIATTAGMALALWIIEQMLKTLIQLNILTLFGELQC